MKKTNLISGLLLATAIVFSFASCNKFKSNSTAKQEGEQSATINKNAKIAYVEVDSVFKYYNMAKDVNSSLEAKQKQLDADLNSKNKAFQSNAMDFRDKVQKGLITQANAQEVQQQLGAKEQELYQLRDQYRSQLAEESQVNQRQVLHNIMDYLKEYNKEKGFQYILANTFPSTILYADSTLNITKEVIAGLNAKYKKEDVKKDKTKK